MGVGGATLPGLDCEGDVEGCSHIGTVQVVTHGVSKGHTLGKAVEDGVLFDPGGVRLKGYSALVSLDLASNKLFSILLI